MPDLPSGRRFAISCQHILPAGTEWFECPPGHFWYQTPDLAINAPPFHPEQEIICDIVHAACPTTPEEAERFVQILEFHGEKTVVPTGLTLDRRERPDGWSAEDWAAWCDWRSTDGVREFLEHVIARCREQAEANIGRGGPVTLRPIPRGVSEEIEVREQVARRRAVAMVRELLELEAALGDPARSGTRDALGALVDDAQALRQELSAMLDDPLYASLPEAWHALGMVSRLLDRPEESERAFVEACRLAPFHLESWLALTRVRGERGDLAGAETAARRAVEVDPRRSEPWANLATTLALQRRPEECRDAVRRALEIYPEDQVAVRLRRHLDAQRDG